ncbi:MAG: hypothetical protein WAL94_06965 [Bacteroidales bacterium]
MKKRGSAMGTFVCCIMLQALFTDASAQITADTSIVKDSPVTVEKGKTHALYAGAGFGSNMVYLGTTISDNNPFGYASVSYGFKDQLYLSATGYTLSGFTPFVAYYSLDLSFSHTFNSWFDIGLSLSRYNIAESLKDTLFSSFTYANATLGFDWRILYTQISTGGLFSDDSWFYLQARNSRYFETPSFAGGKAFFSFDPYVNLIFGTIYTIETTEDTTSSSPGHGGWHRPPKDSATSYSEKFGLMEMDFGLPIAFSYDFFTLELEPGYVLPLYPDAGTTGTQGFVFLASVFFRIF